MYELICWGDFPFIIARLGNLRLSRLEECAGQLAEEEHWELPKDWRQTKAHPFSEFLEAYSLRKEAFRVGTDQFADIQGARFLFSYFQPFMRSAEPSKEWDSYPSEEEEEAAWSDVVTYPSAFFHTYWSFPLFPFSHTFPQVAWSPLDRAWPRFPTSWDSPWSIGDWLSGIYRIPTGEFRSEATVI